MAAPLFREVQRMRQWWLWLILAIVAALAWWSFVQQILLDEPFGDHPAPDWVVWLATAICGVLVPLLLLTAKLEVTVTQEGVRLRYFPFRNRWVPSGAVVAWEAVTYRPIREWGGWGIRYGWGRGWAYTTHGNRGVMLELEGGRRLLVGSQRPEALAQALEALRT